jgi:hypothetical protein
MAGKKVPNYLTELEVSKSPKSLENPAKFKELPVSWQLSYIDDESRWGTNYLRERNSFGNLSSILQELPTDTHNDLVDAVDELNSRNFKSLESLLRTLHRKANNNITVDQLRIILKYLEENLFWAEIYSKIRHFETKPWNVIELEPYGRKGKTKHHYVNISKIIPEAQKRLKRLDLDDNDELFSIRFDGELRIWGIRKFSYFQVLWFDFNHEICPV